MLRKLFLLLIIIVAIFFRFYDVNWDQNQHLHPDERFLTLVGMDMKVPPSFGAYLDPTTSTFNPANINHSFYVYGIFPVVADKLFAIVSGGDNYNDFTILGRMLSAFVDLTVVLFIFKTLELLEKKYTFPKQTKYWGAFFYAIAVLPIQLSHFFAVDTFLNAFAFASFYFALRLSVTKHRRWLLLSAFFLGLAIGSKITAIFIVPLLLFFLVNTYAIHKRIPKHDLRSLFIDLVLFGIVAYCVGRVADPYLFQSANFLDPRPSKLFLDNIKQLNSWSSPDAWFPPGVQWIHKTPILFALQNLVVFGVGIGFFVFVLVGIFFLIKKHRSPEWILLLSWIGLFFLYQSTQATKTMRYFLILYPFLAILAGIGFSLLTKHWHKIAIIAASVSIIIWPLLFFSIYTKPHSRITASRWINDTLPDHSILLSESWDDALPLPITPPSKKTFTIEQLPIFDPDATEKWQKMDTLLAKGNYLILSSNRGWGSIPTVPERYPQMTKFYHDLFAGKTDYSKVAVFTSYPSLTYLGLPITFPDDWAEEAFTVYDHPKVMVFQRTK